MALITPENQKQSVEELCAVSPTPRTLRTPPPPFPLPTTPRPLSPPTPQALPPLTIGSAPHPPGPCSPPVVWGPRWPRQRGAEERVKPATGSAAAHHASPREATGGTRTSARGHSSWFCTAATSSWCEAEEGRNAGRRLSSAGGCMRRGGGRVRGRTRLLTGRGSCSVSPAAPPQCPPPSSPGPVKADSCGNKRREDWKYDTVGQNDRWSKKRGLM